MKRAATHLAALAVVAAVGFSGGVALSQANAIPKLAAMTDRTVAAPTFVLACTWADEAIVPRQDDGDEGRGACIIR